MAITAIQFINEVFFYGENAIHHAEPLFSIIHMVFHETIHLMNSSYFLTFGTIESYIAFFGRKIVLSPNTVEVKTIVDTIFNWSQTLSAKLCSYHSVHGTLMLGTGIAELLLGLQQMDCLALRSTAPLIAGFSNGCFILANAVMLIHNVRLFQLASQISIHAIEEEKQQARQTQYSAILAIVSSINYIVGVAIALIGGPAALIVMFIALGLTSGGLKILCDWISSNN